MKLVRIAALNSALLASLLAAPEARATLATHLGLPAGTGYRLAFVTDEKVAATSADITTYNTFVSAAAARNPDLARLAEQEGLTWAAIISTPMVDAATNVSCSGCNDVPVYLVDGTQLATSTDTMFNGGYTRVLTSFMVDQYGDQESATAVWTGSFGDGTSAQERAAGGAAGRTLVGFNVLYSDGYLNTNNAYNQVGLRSLYALSSELFATGPELSVPEPASLALLGISLVGAGLMRRRKPG